jgi:hypothetical protein
MVMKISLFGLCILGSALMAGSVQAQCGCGSSYYSYAAPRTYVAPVARTVYAAPAPVARSTYAAPMAASSTSPATAISFVNKLATPIDRGAYQLQYAVHLANGRILYTDYMPNGFEVSGTEQGGGSRRVNADIGNDGLVNVNDPASRQVIAIIPR